MYHTEDMTEFTLWGRTARTQKFVWNADGTTKFSHPVPPGVSLRVTSGE